MAPRSAAEALLTAALACVACAACSSDEEAKPKITAGVEAGVQDSGTATPEAGGPPDTDARDASGSGVTPAPEGSPYTTLAEWHLFVDATKQLPSAGVVPYEVISQLFADYATKYRFLYVPEGQQIGYSETDKWALPVGTMLVKTFSYLADARDRTKGERLLETRLLIHESGGWAPHTYVWDDAQTTATLTPGGATIQSHFIDPSGRALDDGYVVPSENDCRSCHGRLGHTDTLGGRTRQLDRDHDYGAGPENQIDHLTSLGLFDRAPEAAPLRIHLVDPFGTAPLVDRARSYFDGNCSHCHQPGQSPASSTGFWLDWDSTDPANPNYYWGVCKQPTAAGGGTCGRQFDVVPGAPDDSIVTCRMESTAPKSRMPTIGRNLVHAEGDALIREWIQKMPGSCSTGAPPDAGNGAPEAGSAPTDSGRADAP